jgi:hypothetical protein
MGKNLNFKPFLNIWYLRPVRIKNAVRELIQEDLEMKCEQFAAGSRLAFGCQGLRLGAGCQGKSGYDSRSYLLQASLSRGVFFTPFCHRDGQFLKFAKE